MSTSPTSNQHPRFGFNAVQLYPGGVALTQASLTAAGVARTAGLGEVCVIGTFTLTAGTGEVNMILEGTNDGANWVTLGQLDLTDLLTTNGQVGILNPDNGQQVDVEHWAMLRVRAVIVSGSPTFSLLVEVGGIHRDSEKFLLRPQASFSDTTVTPITRAVAGTNAAPAHTRPRGTKFTNIQGLASGVNLDGGTSFDATLQGSPDYDPSNPAVATWVDIASFSVTGNGSFVITDGSGSDFIDLACYPYFRIAVVDVGGPGGNAAYTINYWLSLDSMDWLVTGDASGSSVVGLDLGLLEVVFGAPGAEVGDAIAISFAVVDALGQPLPGSRRVEFILYDTTNAGYLDLATNATFLAPTAGTALSALGTNRLIVDTAADGTGTLNISDVQVETVYLTGIQPGAPLPERQVIWQAAEATLVFT